jgi:hypothetical protein
VRSMFEAEEGPAPVPISELVEALRKKDPTEREDRTSLVESAEGGEGREGQEYRDGSASPPDRISLQEIAEATQGRSHGLLLLLLALPETIPMVGFSLILAIPIFLIGILMVRHGPSFPLPRWLGRRTMKRSLLNSTIDRTLPALRRLDRILKPRRTRMVEAGRLQGVVCIVMAVVLAVPLPGPNIMAAFAVAGIGLGILQQDGSAIAAAFGMAVLTLVVIAGVVTGVGLLVWG